MRISDWSSDVCSSDLQSCYILRAEYNSSGGDYFWEIDNLDRRERIDLVSLRLSARWQGATLTGYVENLFGEDYVLEYISQAWSGAPLGNYSSPARGRRWGLQLRYRFCCRPS